MSTMQPKGPGGQAADLHRLMDSLNAGPLSRRRFVAQAGMLGALASFGSVLAACGGGGSNGQGTVQGTTTGQGGGGSLNYFGWEPFAQADLLAPFEKEFGIDITTSFYGTGQEMLTKLQAGGTDIYDMICPMHNDVPAVARGNLAQPFDLSLITNWDKVIPAFADYPDLAVDGEQYMVPFVWGADAIAHNREHIPEVTSWSVLFDPEYKGRIAVLDDAMVTIAMTAIHLGHTDPSPYDLTDDQLEDCKQALIKAKPLWRTVWSNFTDLQNLFVSGDIWVALAWLAVVEPVRQEGIDLGWSLPNEGTPGWIEGMSIVEGSKNRELVHEFANWCIGPDYMYDVFQATGYYPATEAPGTRMTPDERDRSKLSEPELGQQQYYYKTPENMPKWQQAWNEVKAA